MENHNPVMLLLLQNLVPSILALCVMICHCLSSLLPRITSRVNVWDINQSWNTLGHVVKNGSIFELCLCFDECWNAEVHVYGDTKTQFSEGSMFVRLVQG